MRNERKKVSILVPMVHTIPADWFVNFIEFVGYNTKSFELEVRSMSWYLADEARNDLIRQTLNQKELPDYVFFLDADNMPKPDTIARLMHANKDLISALYFEKKPPYYPVVRNIDESGRLYIPTELPMNEIVPVDATGAGCFLVKTEVLIKMGDNWFEVSEGPNKELLGEDINFFLKAKKAGYQLYLDTGCICPHWGGLIDDKPWRYYYEKGLYERNKVHKPEYQLTEECKDCELVRAFYDVLEERPELQLKAYKMFRERTKLLPKFNKFSGEK